jgi:hypothetical protein
MGEGMSQRSSTTKASALSLRNDFPLAVRRSSSVRTRLRRDNQNPFAQTSWKVLDQLKAHCPALSWTLRLVEDSPEVDNGAGVLAHVGRAIERGSSRGSRGEGTATAEPNVPSVIVWDPDGRAFAELVGRGPDGTEVPQQLLGDVTLYGRLLEAVLSQQITDFSRRHDAISAIGDRDPVNGFDSRSSWLQRVELLDEQCAGLGVEATAVVIEFVGIDRIRANFGRLAADERIRDQSFRLRSMCESDADFGTYFGMLERDRCGLIRMGSSTADIRPWLARVCHPSVASTEIYVQTWAGPGFRWRPMLSIFTDAAELGSGQGSSRRHLAAVS